MVRKMTRAEAFVWLPVAAAEDLTPRQLRAFALIAFAQARGIGLTEAELAAGLRHHSGKQAGPGGPGPGSAARRRPTGGDGS